MRIGVATWSSRLVAGTETYLHAVLPRLQEAGHELALLCETTAPAERAPILDQPSVPHWSVAELGLETALGQLRGWDPDALFVNCPREPALEERLVRLAPAVLLVHNYHGTCISGHKANRWPVAQPCGRHFGPACLLHYLPRRCGGWNPVTMVQLYGIQSRRHALLPRYRAVLTLSEHMRQEFVRHGVAKERAIVLPPPGFDAMEGTPVPKVKTAGDPWRLIYLGRMEMLKGGQLLLDALPLVLTEVQRPLHLALAGDGPERAAWQRRAAQLMAMHPELRIDFPGWVAADAKRTLLSKADLLVVPSIWPEPFGLVGVEAARQGVPAAAFAVGGMRDWLVDGVTGKFAPGNPPTARGLATAITACLRDPAQHQQMATAAAAHAATMTLKKHVNALERALAAAADVGLPGAKRQWQNA